MGYNCQFTSMKKGILTMMCLLGGLLISAQNIIVQQNNSTQKQEPKVVYKEKVVYVEKQQQGPILVAGYLWVYPEKLGEFTRCPNALINGINKKRAYGKSTWRLPTNEEATIIAASKNINLKDFGYKSTWGPSMNGSYHSWTMWTSEKKDNVYEYEMTDEAQWFEYAYLILVCDD